MHAVEEYGLKKIAIAGGVASNSRLRELITERAGACGIEILRPSPVLCTDNGVMIACSAYYAYRKGETSDLTLDADPALEF